MIVLPVRIIMSPTSSRRFFSGRNPRSPTVRTAMESQSTSLLTLTLAEYPSRWMTTTWAAGVGIALDHRADVAIGVQLDWSIRAAIAAGRLGPGQRFPALRDLAQELGVNHNTVRAAVAKLEAEGLLE